MATTVNYGWLKDKNGNKFSPKTLSSQIITNEGKSFEEKINQQIKENTTMIETASGELIVVNDSAEAKPLGLAIDGKSEQAQYSGKNLLNLKHLKQSTSYGITFTPVFDDNENLMYIEANGTNDGTSDSSYTILGVGNELYNQILGKEIIVSGSVGGSQTTYKLQYWSQAAVIASLNGDSSVGTVLETTDWNISIVVRKGQTVSKLRFYPMIRLATVTDGTYEPFCDCQPSPSPSYPQEIRNIGVYDEASGKYAVEVKGTRKNLLDCSGLVENINRGITFTPVYDENGLLEYIEANGTASATISFKLRNGNLNLDKGNYILSGCPSGGSSSSFFLEISGDKWLRDYGENAILNYSEDAKDRFVQIVIQSGYTADKLRFYPMIRLAEITDDTYEPWQETTTTVLLDEPLRKVDKAYWNGGSKVRVDRKRKRIKVLPTMGFKVWATRNAKYNRYMLTVDDVADESNLAYMVMSDYFASTTKSNAFNEKVPCGVFIDTTSSDIRYIGFVDGTHSTIDDFKQFLTDNDVFVEYELAEPITEEIDIDLDDLSMFYPTTILSNDCNANMEIEYIKSNDLSNDMLRILDECGSVDHADGIVVNVEMANWIAEEDGTYTNTVAIEGILKSEMYDISLYSDSTEEQAYAYDFLVTDIDTYDGQVVLTASEEITVAFSVILKGKVNLENKNVYVSDLSATNIEYDNSESNLDSTNMQNAIDELATSINGLIVTITTGGWDLQSDGNYKKVIQLNQITGNEVMDVCLCPGDTHTEQQIIAFNELITSIKTEESRLILTATEVITVSFRILLYGKINFDKTNLMVLADADIGAKAISLSQAEYDALSEDEKNNGIYVTPDGEDLTAKNLFYDGSETGLGNNVQDAIDNQNKNLTAKDFGTTISLTSGVDYIAESDGYVSAQCGWQAKSEAQIHVNGVMMARISSTNMDTVTINTFQRTTVFVRKGSVVKAIGVELTFIPLIN